MMADGRQVEPSSSKTLVERSLAPLAAVGAFAAAIVAAVTKGDKLVALLIERPLIVGGITALATIAVILTLLQTLAARLGPARTRLIRWTVVAGVALAYLATISFETWCVPARLCESAVWRPVHLGLLLTPAMAAERPLIVQSMFVDASRSSFRLATTNISIHGETEPQPRVEVAYDQRMYQIFGNASCRSLDGEQPILDALPVWRALLSARGDKTTTIKLQDYAGYRNLIQQGGQNAFFDALPNASEMGRLKAQQPEQYRILMRWLADCVGLSDPVLIWTVRNQDNAALTLTRIDYQVLDVGQVKGGGPAAVPVIDVEDHQLAHRKGLQEQLLEPAIQLPPGSTAQIRIRLILEDTDFGYTWLVQPRFVATDGTSAEAAEVKIFAAKAAPRVGK
jgi:hypothetical protein